MADKVLKSITFPNLTDRYTIPQVDDTLSTTGKAADAKKTGDEITELKEDLIRTESILETVNYILKYGFVDGILTEGGSVTPNTSWKTTADFIPVVTNEQYVTESKSIPCTVVRATYDSSKNFLELTTFTQTTESRPFTILNGVAYVKYSVSAAVFRDFAFRLETNRIDKINVNVDVYKNAYDNGYTLFNVSDFINGGLNSGQINYAQAGRVVMRDIHYADKTINVKVDTSKKRYRIAYHTYDENGTWAGFDSTWQTEITIKPNTYYRVVMWDNDANVYSKHDIVDYIKNAHIKWIYNNNPYSYEYIGEFLDFRKRGFDTSELFTGDYTVDGTNVAQQGLAIYNNIIVCAFSRFGGEDLNKVRLYDMMTGDIISTLDCTIGHGDTLSFSDDFYDSSDEFPLLYATADTNPAQVYVNRITRNSATLIRTLTFPLENTGYYAGHVIDIDNNILYMIGYTNQNYLSDNGGNDMIFSLWNLSNLEAVADNVYTPELVSSFTLPFMKCLQGQKYLNGNLFLLSSTSNTSANDTRIYVVNTKTKTVISLFNKFPSNILSGECEDFDFVLDGRNYYMVIHLQNGAFYKIEF